MLSSSSTPIRLYLIRVAVIPPINLPIVCYLLQTSDGKNILIDTGLPSGEIQPPPGLEAPVMNKNVIEQLAELGLQPSDIDTLVCTHFDPDHAGRLDEFPNAQLIVQKAHYESALNNPRFARLRSHWDLPLERYAFVEGDTELFPCFDLIETSGHTTGHQSILLRLPETGAILLAIDAVHQEDAFTLERKARAADENEAELIASTKKLLDLVAREDIKLVVFGHDGEQWDKLKKLPEYYS